jgi:hypothetical protein
MRTYFFKKFPSIKQRINIMLAQADTWRGWLTHKKRGPLEAEVPWITLPAIDWLESYVTSYMNVFEWGSGGSTAYLARRVQHITSIEHDPAWFAKVKLYISLHHLQNIRLIFMPAEDVWSNEKEDPYRSTSSKHRQYRFERYAKAIDAFPDSSFDLIMIDGRSRAACLMHAKNKIKVGGYIVLDDSGRSEYARQLSLLQNFERKDFPGPVPYLNSMEQTSILKRLV